MSDQCEKREKIRKIVEHWYNPDSDYSDGVRQTAKTILAILNEQSPLEQAAKKAAATGNKEDLQEYLRLRKIYNDNAGIKIEER